MNRTHLTLGQQQGGGESRREAGTLTAVRTLTGTRAGARVRKSLALLLLLLSIGPQAHCHRTGRRPARARARSGHLAPAPATSPHARDTHPPTHLPVSQGRGPAASSGLRGGGVASFSLTHLLYDGGCVPSFFLSFTPTLPRPLSHRRQTRDDV